MPAARRAQKPQKGAAVSKVRGPRIGKAGPRVVRESTAIRVEKSGASPEFKRAARRAVRTNPKVMKTA